MNAARIAGFDTARAVRVRPWTAPFGADRTPWRRRLILGTAGNLHRTWVMAHAMTSEDWDLHHRAVAMAGETKRIAASLLDLVARIDRFRLFRKFGHRSLHEYCVRELDLSDGMACDLRKVMRASKAIPQLGDAVREGLCITKARRISSVMTPETAADWIDMARRLSKAQLEREIAKVKPRALEHDRIRPSSEGRVEVSFFCSEAEAARLERVREVHGNLKRRSVTLSEAIIAAADLFLDRRDPVVRADRAVARGRPSLRAQVDARDRGECQHVFASGKKCGARQFVEQHHHHARSRGGPDRLENMVTLCWACHREWHEGERDVNLRGDPAFDPEMDGGP